MFTILVTVLVVLVVVAIGLSYNSTRRKAEEASDVAASLFTRFASLQTRHTVAAYFNYYGESGTAVAVRSSTSSTSTTFSRVVGSVDIAPRRVDWMLRTSDPHGKLGERPTIALWVQMFNATTHRTSHLVGSPLVLCNNKHPIALPCSGHIDKPPFMQALESQPPEDILFAVALYHETVNLTRPVWLIALN